MATYLEVVNKVLKKLREDPVTTVDANTYSTLIGEFVNIAKREVEDAHNWSTLLVTSQVTTAAGTFEYTLTGVGERFRMIHAFMDTEDYEMKLLSRNALTRYLNNDDITQQKPYYYGFNGFSTGRDPNVDFWPIPDGVYTINFDLIVPQEDLVDDEESLLVADWPVILRAWSIAISERGEDGGALSNEVDGMFLHALSDLIQIDSAREPEDMVIRVI